MAQSVLPDMACVLLRCILVESCWRKLRQRDPKNLFTCGNTHYHPHKATVCFRPLLIGLRFLFHRFLPHSGLDSPQPLFRIRSLNSRSY